MKSTRGTRIKHRSNAPHWVASSTKAPPSPSPAMAASWFIWATTSALNTFTNSSPASVTFPAKAIPTHCLITARSSSPALTKTAKAAGWRCADGDQPDGVATVAGAQEIGNREFAETPQVRRQQERDQDEAAGPSEHESQSLVAREIERAGQADERGGAHPVGASIGPSTLHWTPDPTWEATGIGVSQRS